MESSNQLSQMQILMEQLVKMVGHNNAATEELSQRLASLETKVDNLEAKADRLETSMDRLETKVDRLETRMDKLETKVDTQETNTAKGFADVVQMLTILGEKVDKIAAAQALQSEMLRQLAADTAQHEAEITLLKRAK